MIILRPEQEAIITYTQGKMGISAVPGSGKTWTLSYLAATLIQRGLLADDQEILVVTLVNSAVDNFYQRINNFIYISGLIPGIGYRVRTLHGLAHDIVRERPSLLGLDNNFIIVDERESTAILNDISNTWLKTNFDRIAPYLNSELSESKLEWVRREHLPSLINSIAYNVIRVAKDQQLTPTQLRKRIEAIPIPIVLTKMGCDIYEHYQESLAYRAAVDFDDLIRLALQALDSDPLLLQRLQNQWPYILEDEAQDSSRLQELILRKLTTPNGNWVRVGDPNQAIYETFTTANPKYLKNFLAEPDVISHHLPISGRSTQRIINLANYLVQWVQNDHPFIEARTALSAPPFIKPTAPDDPQANPDDKGSTIQLMKKNYSPESEISAIAKSLQNWLPDHPNETVAVLAPRNHRATEVINQFIKLGIPYNDSLLKSSSSTRFTAGAIGNLLQYLATPYSSTRLANAFRVWRRTDTLTQESKSLTDQAASILKKLSHVEDYLWPGPQGDWLEESNLAESDPSIYDQFTEFRSLICRWQQAVNLPIDQIILTLAQDLFSEPVELAVAHKLSVLLRQYYLQNPDLRLSDLAHELGEIARNERRFIGFSDEDGGFDPDAYKGVAVVTTMHKAKGLEWDRVYLMSVSNYDFPSGQPCDTYISERFFIRDSLNLEAEAVAQLHAVLNADEYSWYQEGQATQQARLDYIQERLRLLYVGITRAKKELIITWNTGKSDNRIIEPALPLVALQNYLDLHKIGEL